MSVKVKICGVRSAEMAEVAVAAGADYLGFNFVPESRRKVTPELAQEIIAGLRRPVLLVGVFRNAPLGEVNRLAHDLGLDLVQLHGDEDEDYIASVSVPVIKLIGFAHDPVRSVRTMEHPSGAAYYLLDRPVQGQGDMIDLVAARELAQGFDVFVAGGLTPDNVTEVVRSVHPYAVDVAGGIEHDGKPDPELIRRFVMWAKAAG